MALDDNIAIYMTVMMRLPFMHGFANNRWAKSLDVMLEKKSGVRQIHQLWIIGLVKAELNTEPDLERDKGVQGFCKHGRECIFDICLSNTESRSHRNKDPLKCLKSQEKEKRNKYEAACHEQRKDF